ncbi:MAG: twin-arginine translocase TatA/TatE family subunit [Flexilinea sp.]|nr:twin-arginine translocase TatA/TatE family subunit [Flexilinea sp.]
MRIFNVGIREVILLLVILLILFGPRQLQENARKTAQAIRRFVRSDTWRSFLGIYDDVNNIKEEVIRESGIREVQDSLRGINRQLSGIDSDLHQPDWTGTGSVTQNEPETADGAQDLNEIHESEQL